MQKENTILRFMTCGSVDDGKSTLIGRLLFESKSIFDDQMITLEQDSRQFGTQGEKLDMALLVDGLQAEREQGITIDVAYRYFSTPKRRFIIADSPGHEQYTRNMVTAASTADLAIVLIDARKGLLTQTRRHSRIVSLMGITHVVLAVTKMDLVDYSQEVYENICKEYVLFSKTLNFKTVYTIPISGLNGDNILIPSHTMTWFKGLSLLSYLENVSIEERVNMDGFILPIQWVNRPNLHFRGYCGTIAQGKISVNEPVYVLPFGTQTRIKEIFKGFDSVSNAKHKDAVTVTLMDEVDVSRGNVIVADIASCEMADQFEASVIWMSQEPMYAGRQYVIKVHHQEMLATITGIKYLYDINTGSHLASNTLCLNHIACVTLATNASIIFKPYVMNHTLGAFILMDKHNCQTLAAGMIQFALRRSRNIHWQSFDITSEIRAKQKNQIPKCIWFTGLSGSGKSTIANALEHQLHYMGKHTYILDGDNVRHGLNRDLGFTEADRIENIRRVAEVAKLMVDAGLIVLVSFISPFKSEREMARNLFNEGVFIEVFVDTPLHVCEERNVKGLYAKARKGELKNFTGIDSPYEKPLNSELCIQTESTSVQGAVDRILEFIS